jgi:16S rRNA (cytosine1402-N4)-methyltransferase
MPTIHVSVMPQEVIEGLAPRPGGVFADGTLGGGGHTRLLAQQVGETGLVIAVDRDPQALDRAGVSLAGLPIKIAQANFCDLPEVLKQVNTPLVDGMLLDLGLSSDQLADGELGFSYQADGPLDLRFDPGEGQPAWQWLEYATAEQIANSIYQYGEERFSRRIARKIVERRRNQPIRTAAELADLVRSCVPRSKNHSIDPATRTFQALRIVVNRELEALEQALQRLPYCLKPQGRIAIISFHSLEDRLVKNAFRSHECLEVVTRKPLRPTEGEVAANPRSRSARLRIAQRTPTP